MRKAGVLEPGGHGAVLDSPASTSRQRRRRLCWCAGEAGLPRAALQLILLLSSLLPAGAVALATTRQEPPSASVCLLAPRITGISRGEPIATVPIGQPTLLATDPLAEVRILRGGALAWWSEADRKGPIEGPLPWPLAPIQPREPLTLLLRPFGAPAETFALIRLVGDTPRRMQTAARLLQGLGRHPERWQAAVEEALQREDLALASALLFAFDGPSTPDLDALRLMVFRRGCD